MTVVRMWEAVCAGDQVDAVLAWLRESVASSALAAGACKVELFRSGDRVVLQTSWARDDGWREPEAPAGVVRSHAWPFELVAAL